MPRPAPQPAGRIPHQPPMKLKGTPANVICARFFTPASVRRGAVRGQKGIQPPITRLTNIIIIQGKNVKSLIAFLSSLIKHPVGNCTKCRKRFHFPIFPASERCAAKSIIDHASKACQGQRYISRKSDIFLLRFQSRLRNSSGILACTMRLMTSIPKVFAVPSGA